MERRAVVTFDLDLRTIYREVAAPVARHGRTG
jgi:hypothetical protein